MNTINTADAVVRNISTAVEEVRKQNPLVGSWTNFVTINLVANAQLAVGGRAAMCFLPDEAEPLAFVSKSIYVNVGTLQPIACQSLPAAAKAAAEANKPWVLDPVAAGLGDTRTSVLKDLKQYKPTIIRGNASEIITLANLWGLETEIKGKVEGVDSTDTVREAASSALKLAEYTGGAVAVSGEIDLILNSEKAYYLTGGSEMLECITGAGCSLGGVMAVFAAVTDALTAALTASVFYKAASDKAVSGGKIGTFSFQTAFVDYLSLLTPSDIAEYSEKHLTLQECD
ncbi:hydroxyethylthiazole kinase [Methanimicrococcus blatticola]|uniref:Hydroxyethylthiazole kinase n=1 Tax=Methanimicrococcus blatticola TaxID=91560 RepID=A0A484F5G6_9EURY|nr:hydroxyethylthiazole kinase [Methanimicrococcus blatticola]MBZ3935403.1 hydroxyethylthiazole kinase [Methanimicrococcus blatticola]MCC2508499.1 hydroxyethylthiazole kinase [Methanimicrococcus blatticola]TDQ67808.1 hydroxyethylthiazole kinase [Methanimicrococcus blatticola]